MQTKVKCPCCGGNMPAAPVPLEFVPDMLNSRIDRRMVRAMANAWPHGVHRDALVDVAYADDIDGGPECAYDTIRTHLSLLRKKLLKYGWTISRCKSKHIPEYKLIPAREYVPFPMKRKKCSSKTISSSNTLAA